MRKEGLSIWSMIHDQDDPSCPYMVNTFKNFLLYNPWADWYVASGSLLLHDDRAFTLTSLLRYVYKRSVSSYPTQISHCSLGAQGSDMDLMVLLFTVRSQDFTIMLKYRLFFHF